MKAIKPETMPVSVFREKYGQGIKKKPKARPRAGKQPKTDVFTALCLQELKVEVVKEYRFHPIRMWRFDYAIPSHHIALEVEGGVWTGGRHTRSQGFLGDMEKYNTAAIFGWKVLRTVPDDLLTGKTIDLLRAAIHFETQDNSQ